MAGESRRKRLSYTRAELEALTPPDTVLHLWWSSLYQSLDPAVVREYEGLCATAGHSWSDERNRSSLKSNKKKNKKKAGVKPMEGSGKRVNQFNRSMGFECDNFTAECNSVITEESFNGEEDTDDDYDSIQRPAFLVEGQPNFDSGPPEDGLEYLRRVRSEAMQLPRVKVVKFNKRKCKEQTPYIPKIPEIAKCPQSLLPMKEWVDTFLADFANLRQVFSRMESWRGVPSHHTPATRVPNAAGSGAHHPNGPPTMSTLSATTPVSRVAMLRKHVMDLENESTLSRNNCLWIFALCVAVDVPLDAEMGATMRSLLRKCSSLLTSRSDPDDAEVIMLNILIVISGNYFRQSEEHHT